MLTKAIEGRIPAPFSKNIEENQCSDIESVISEEIKVPSTPLLLLNASEETAYTEMSTTVDAPVGHKNIKHPMPDIDVAISTTPRRFKTKIPRRLKMAFPSNEKIIQHLEDCKENEQQDIISSQDKTSQLGKDTQNFQSGAGEELAKDIPPKECSALQTQDSVEMLTQNSLVDITLATQKSVNKAENLKISLPLNLSTIKKLKEKQEIQKKEIDSTKKVKESFEQRQNETTGVGSEEIFSFILNGTDHSDRFIPILTPPVANNAEYMAKVESLMSLCLQAVKAHTNTSTSQYVQLIRNAKKTEESFKVEELNYDDFIDLKALTEEIRMNSTKTTDGNTMKLTEVKMIRFLKNSDTYEYKTTFDEKEAWTKVLIKPKTASGRRSGRSQRENSIQNVTLKPAYLSKIPIAEQKKKDLLSLIQKHVVPKQYKYFYDSIF